jgi:DNA-binding SARP family transcriptional activator
VACSFSIRKVLALTLYLAVTGQSHFRAHLIALLWPDADETHGLLNLRQTLLRIRRVLGFDADTDTEIYLHTAADSYVRCWRYLDNRPLILVRTCGQRIS